MILQETRPIRRWMSDGDYDGIHNYHVAYRRYDIMIDTFGIRDDTSFDFVRKLIIIRSSTAPTFPR